jgi:hypothetical protein
MARMLLESVASLSLAKNLEFIGVDTPIAADAMIKVVVDKTKEGECLTPFELEDWIVQKIAEGYKFELDLWYVGKHELDFSVGGISLKAWYENILQFVETL